MENAVTEVNVVSGVSESKPVRNIETYFSNFTLTSAKIKFLSAFALGSFFGCALRSSYRHTKDQQLKNIRSGFALGIRALGIATVLSVSGVGLLILSISAAFQVDSLQQFGQKMVNLCGDRFRINRGESVTTFAEILETANSSKEENLPKCRRALLVVAHPDDETMFFTPTLHGLRLSGSNIYLLCISTGNSSGLGVTRKYELASAFIIHGLSLDNLTILDYDNFQDGFIQWSKEELAKVILRHMQMLDVDLVITFDEGGVSAHPNHIGCFRALQYLYTNGLIPAGVQIFVLESVPLWRKYVVFLDAVISSFHSTFLYISSPLLYITAWRAMWAHRSQLVWFRYLYMLFSRYVVINTLKRIHAQPRHPIHKKKLRSHC